VASGPGREGEQGVVVNVMTKDDILFPFQLVAADIKCEPSASVKREIGVGPDAKFWLFQQLATEFLIGVRRLHGKEP
jgi:hypothetical protein